MLIQVDIKNIYFFGNIEDEESVVLVNDYNRGCAGAGSPISITKLKFEKN